MIFLLTLLTFVYAFDFQLSKLPSSGTPSKQLKSVAAAYNNETNEILIFGGQNLENEQYSSTISKFNLDTLLWGEVYFGSELKPPGLMYPIVLMQSSTKLLVLFGIAYDQISSECYRFDLSTRTWEVAVLGGDSILGRIKGANCEFEYNNTRYLALYGGNTYEGKSYELFLIDIETLIVKKIETSNSPTESTSPSLVYYAGSLYLFENYVLQQLDLDSLVWTTTTLGNKRIYSHKSFIINNSMYIFFGFDFTSLSYLPEILKINLTDYTFTVVFTEDSAQAIQASIQVNSIIYILYGQSETCLLSIRKYELIEDEIKKTVIVENGHFPSRRRNHASFQFDNDLYIFGGISESGKYLNDLWKFDILQSSWSKMDIAGAVPEARELMGYNTMTGYGLLIFGGRSSTVYSDLKYFQVKSQSWFNVELASIEPPARYSSCITNYFFRLVIIGGQNDFMIFSDVWIYDTLTKSYYKATITDLPLELMNHKCSLKIIDLDTVHVYVIGGSDFNFNPNKSVYKVEIKGFKTLNFQVKSEILLTDNRLASSESPLIASPDCLMLISGSLMRDLVFSTLIYFNISANTVIYKTLPTELGLFGHTAVHLGKSIYIFGGGLSISRIRMPGITSNQLYKLTWDELGCGAGSQSPDCKSCPKGYYEESNTCNPCLPGTYSDILGASGIIACIPCTYGSFNDKMGSGYCKLCSNNTFCPIMSRKVQNKLYDLVPISEQPEDFKGSGQFLSDIQYMLWMFILGVLSVILLLLFFFKPIKSRLKNFDLFINIHSQKLGTPVVLRKTFIGGIFSIYFLSIALITICVGLMGFIYDNVSEIKTLVPILTLTDEIKSSTLTVEFQLYDYKGFCQINGKCNSDYEIDESGFAFIQRTDNCKLIDTKCSVLLVYEDFQLKSDGYLNFTAKESLVSTTFFTVNIEASSSIPEGKSKSFVPVYPEDRKKLFRGLDATNVNFEFIPSVFKSDNDLFKDNTGYHVRYKPTYTPGTTINQQEFYSNAYLIISLKFEISSTGFITKRSQIYSFGIFIGGLLGTIFGLMGSFGTAMGCSEVYFDKVNEAIIKKRQFKKVVETRENIIDTFEDLDQSIKITKSFHKIVDVPTENYVEA